MKISIICRKEIIYKKDNTSPLALKLTHNNQKRVISLGIKINPQYWNPHNQSFTENCPERESLQYKIDSKVQLYQRRIRQMEALDIEVTLDNVLDSPKKTVYCTLGECFNTEIDRLKTLGKISSAIKHKAILALLQQFTSINTRMNAIDLAFLNDFELFLQKHGYNNNSLATTFSTFKALYNKALSEGRFLPKANPFQKFKVGRLWSTTAKRAIDKEDLHRLIKLKIPTCKSQYYLAFAKDIFLFTYLTAGINFRDIATLQYANIRNNRIYYTRHKTGKKITCRLMPQALQIIQKYSTPEHDEQDYIFPILDRKIHKTAQQQHNRIHKVLAKVNSRLKELGQMAGIQTPLTTYVARHTYATVLKRSGVNIAIISESLGHSDLSTTQIYLDSFENDQIDEAMKNLL